MTEYLRHLLVPHHTNNFRAKLLHVDFLLLYIALFFCMTFSFKTVHRLDPTILGFATNIHIDQLLSSTNQKRAEAGLSNLKLNAQLSEAAAEKAKHMFTNNYWAHTSPSGATPWDFIIESGYTYSVAGENLAKNFSDSTGVVEAWMNSPSHRENLLRAQYEDIGFAVVNGVLNGEETTLVVQMFGKPLSTVASADDSSVPGIGVPPVEEAAAEEPQAIAQTELPATVPAALAPATPAPVEVAPVAASVTKNPIFDIPTLTKRFSLAFGVLLIALLVFDAYYVWKSKIVRVRGKSLAHIAFLLMLTGAVWFMSFGSIV